MATPYKTPRRGQGKENMFRQGGSGGKVKAVDLVTGKAKVEYFFDPSLVLQDRGSDTPYKGGAPATPATPFRRELSNNSDGSTDPLEFSSKHLFLPCTIIKPLDETGNTDAVPGGPVAGPTLVKTSDGTLHKIRDSTLLIPVTSPDDYMGIEDVLHLPNVTEASLVNTLRLRYRRDDIYTSAGPILLSINPYRTISFPNGESLYSETHMMQYRNKADYDEELPPHLFQVADRAYSALMSSIEPIDLPQEEDAALALEHHVPPGTVRNQSIIISGESGAGKTEATKYIMQYLARITKKPSATESIMSPDGRLIAALEDRVLSSNPLLETFGNARTLRNDNSSRFGKFIHIYFSTETGTITGASISNYLLEKTRITHQIDGERNYHIFYQLLAGGQDELLDSLGLTDGTSGFQYLMNRDASKSRRDTNGFAETKECLSRIGLDEEDQQTVFRIVAAVLHLGNIKYEEKGDTDEGESENASLSEDSRASLSKACKLLGLDEGKVLEAMLTKLLTIGGKTIHKAQNVPQAEDKRDAFAKLTYSCLFLWLVKRVNETLKSQEVMDDDSADGNFALATAGENETGFIGVLDIYGFEVFETNGYEQLLINYCNEKLQRHFNRHLFEVEQDLYASEGVDWTYITFNDNRPCLELIEGVASSVGILNTLDDAWGGMGTASEKDVKFVSHLHSIFGGSTPKSSKKAAPDDNKGHKHYVMPKFGNDRQFIIVHYAGDVRYTANGFVEKNMESLSNELKDIGAESSISLTQKIFSCGSREEDTSTVAASRRSSIRGVSVASQFRSSLQSLVEDLECTQPHYIRCIKPNLAKAPNSLNSGEVLRQLRYSGMMEAIRIRREGYALREDHESFYNRFSVLLDREDFGEEAGIEQLVSSLSKRLNVTDADWQIGHSKIFLRRELADKLERLAKLKVHVAARTVGRFGRFVAERRAAGVLAVWGRFRLHMLEMYRRRRAATKIIASFRRHQQATRFSTMRSVAVFLQSHQRRKTARKHVDKIRNPYGDMSYKEMKRLFKLEQARLDEAVSKSDFNAASEIGFLLATMEEVIQSKKPFTRSMLESEICKVQDSLDDALARKAYPECGPLQQQLEEMKGRRAELPTMDELKEDVATAEAEVAAAANSRDFSSAASGQARVEKAKKKLNEAIEAEAGEIESDDEEGRATEEKASNHGFESRTDLERAIVDLTQKIKTAIDSKDFQTATSLQITLEGRERLRPFFPTVQELNAQVLQARDKLEKSLSKKDFIKAGELDEQVAALEAKLAAEVERSGKEEISTANELTGTRAAITESDGTDVLFESRFDLESEISVSTKKVDAAVAAKEFKNAEALQVRLDELEKLRLLLPSVTELESDIRDKKTAMDKAIREKKFATAEDINGELERLQQKLQGERSRVESRVSIKGRDGDVDSVRSTPSVRPRMPVVAKATSVSEGIQPRRPVTRPLSQISAQSRNDDMSDVSSSNSLNRGFAPVSRTKVQQLNSLEESIVERPVSKLRPKKPLLSSPDDSVVSITRLLANKRGDAALVVSTDGGLAGIITDTDITRRVVAKNIDPATTRISCVMTPDPTCVSMSDSAMDALQTMVENHFRHLPVVNDEGRIVGLLDIAKCLNDAISKLETRNEKTGTTAEAALLQAAGMQGAGSAQAAALQALLGPLMAQAFGDQKSPTLRSLLAGKPATIVQPETTLRDAGIVMAERRKAALVVNDGSLVGIFAFKDMMSRAVAKELPLDHTFVNAVMTADPECVSPDITVLEALQIMHDNKFLTLPVCESDGRVVGLVDVMDVIYGCGGADGWRSVFSSVMQIDDDSDTSSVLSFSERSHAGQSTRSARSTSHKDERPVSRLRPKKPLLSSADDSILSTTQMLTTKRGDASLVIGADGTLAGIITDTDITRRVVAKRVDPESSSVSTAMTPNPTCVAASDPAIDALQTMVENHFRHLPVVDDTGAVVGLLDIAKCLNDAIGKLEKAQIKDSRAAEDAVKQAVGLNGVGNSQAAALQALLGPLMSQAFGNKSSPTLRSMLAGKPATVVSPDTNLRDTGIMMAERRKAALVVGDGKLVGIFGFKDMMSRAVAKELPLEDTPVSAVMTPDPESVSPDMTVLEALQTMHDNKFLTLPVCEKGGDIVGLVDVMDLIYGCGGAEGWRSVFSQAMELDDGSDASSVYSRGEASHAARSMANARGSTDARPVSKLRPRKPILSSVNDSILSMTQILANKRGDASLVTTPNGSLAGIITDTDITRRVVAKDVDPASTTVSVAMTPDPTCVSMSDSAMDALQTMVENHFRHLPVLDDEGAVVGLLDIAKCLNDAITKLERAQNKSSKSADDAVKQVAGLQGAGAAQAAALQALLGPLMAQAFGNQASPTLRSLLAGRPTTIVSPSTTVRETGVLMADRRKAALVVEDDNLVGIFGFKDMMTRAVAKEILIDKTPVSTVMTPNPESVLPDVTVLEALQTMHDNGFLTLPVCEEDGQVVGIVDVMDLIYGCGGAEGWRSIFSQAIDLDDSSETNSVFSREKSVRSKRISNRSVDNQKQDSRLVSKLRPKKPLMSSPSDSILSMTQMLSKRRGDASVVVDERGTLAGIITDTDITRRVVAKHVDPESAAVSVAMTPNPTCVATTDSAMDALQTMVENHFRHLPVIGEDGTVIGLLDIAKCLNDAISRLERAQEKSNKTAEDAVKQVSGLQGAGGAQAAALQALLGPLMAQALGSQSSPTLRSLLAGKPATIVGPETSLREAGMLMAERRKAALVVENGRMIGLFGFKDMMCRAVAKELSLDDTAVSAVMTPEPESVSPNISVLEALQVMHDHGFLTLPVCEEDGRVVGLVDVMDLIYGCGGAEGWRSVFDNAMDLDDDFSATSDQPSNIIRPPTIKTKPVAVLAPESAFFPNLPNNIPTHVEIGEGAQSEHGSFNESFITDNRGFSTVESPSLAANSAVFKLTDPSGHTHRIRSELKKSSLLKKLVVKMGGDVEPDHIHMKFVDDEGDAVMITSDECLVEAAQLANGSGNEVVKLTITVVKPKAAGDDMQKMLIAGASAAVAVAALGVMVMLKGKRG